MGDGARVEWGRSHILAVLNIRESLPSLLLFLI